MNAEHSTRTAVHAHQFARLTIVAEPYALYGTLARHTLDTKMQLAARINACGVSIIASLQCLPLLLGDAFG